jgi:hypothetical protein
MTSRIWALELPAGAWRSPVSVAEDGKPMPEEIPPQGVGWEQ